MTQDNNTFLGFDKKQIPLLALLAAFGGILIAFGGIIIALQMGTRSDVNANHAATQADIHALNSRVDALQSVMVANDNAHRAEMNALRDDIKDLSVEAAETNARIVNIESRLPEYASVDERLDHLEREQARLNQLVADLVNAE